MSNKREGLFLQSCNFGCLLVLIIIGIFVYLLCNGG